MTAIYALPSRVAAKKYDELDADVDADVDAGVDARLGLATRTSLFRWARSRRLKTRCQSLAEETAMSKESCHRHRLQWMREEEERVGRMRRGLGKCVE